jgi:hypothetical protein
MLAPRALAVWLVIIAAETVHGVVRTLLLAPAVGDFRARQLAVVSGCAIIFGVTWLFVRWLRATTARELFAVGLAWVILTVGFEIGLGRLTGLTWERIFEDYDLPNGGFLGLGLLFLALAPLLAARYRGMG